MEKSKEEEEVANLLANMNKQSFISRVANLPVLKQIVTETGKSNIIRYSADAVEVGVKSIISESSLGKLDEFGCRQLDRLESFFSASGSSGTGNGMQNEAVANNTNGSITDRNSGAVNNNENKSGVNGVNNGYGFKWNNYLSQESKRSLNYCLEWLDYAVSHIDAQIILLKNEIQGVIGQDSLMQLMQIASKVKREVVETVRKVVEVIGRYAGNALPLEARNLVRGFILSLPNRWQSIQRTLTMGWYSMPVQYSNQEMNALNEANKVLTLAEESNFMLKSTMAVFGQANGNVSPTGSFIGTSSEMSSSPVTSFEQSNGFNHNDVSNGSGGLIGMPANGHIHIMDSTTVTNASMVGLSGNGMMGSVNNVNNMSSGSLPSISSIVGYNWSK